jgi:DUF971 family protein
VEPTKTAAFSGLPFAATLLIAAPVHTPQDIQLIGTEVALRWDDGRESYLSFATLRAASPSAEVRGERDIFGNQYGGEVPRNYVGIAVTGWERIGNYAIRFDFSDGHRTGLYSYDLLRKGEAGPD